MDRQNLTLLTDLYELTMMQGYFKNKVENKTVVFDAFFRNNPFGGGLSETLKICTSRHRTSSTCAD